MALFVLLKISHLIVDSSRSGSFSMAAANRSNTGSPETILSVFSTERKAYAGTSILLCTKDFRKPSCGRVSNICVY